MPKRLTPRGEAAPPVEPINTGATLPPAPSPAKARRAHQQKKEAEVGAAYVRNLHEIQARVTLNSGRVLELKPRGQREDMDIVTAEEQEDPKFLANYGLIFELIAIPAAKQIISQQQHNASNAEHPLWTHLRNPEGKQYEQRVVVMEEAFEKQGVVIGTVEQTGPTGAHLQENIAITRVKQAGPQITAAPGSIGHPATDAMLRSVPDSISADEYAEFLAFKKFKEAQDDAARQAGAEEE